MTTPDTSAVRAWARSNGYDVADRGRLPAELTDAYLAAQGEGSGTAAGAKKPAAKKTSAKKAPAKKASRSTATKATKAAAAPVEQKAAATTAPAKPDESARPEPRPKPSPVSEDRRLVALGEQLAALTDRVAALEKALGDKSTGKSGGKRFRRSR